VNIKFPRATYHTIVPSTEELYCLSSWSIPCPHWSEDKAVKIAAAKRLIFWEWLKSVLKFKNFRQLLFRTRPDHKYVKTKGAKQSVFWVSWFVVRTQMRANVAFGEYRKWLKSTLKSIKFRHFLSVQTRWRICRKIPATNSRQFWVRWPVARIRTKRWSVQVWIRRVTYTSFKV